MIAPEEVEEVKSKESYSRLLKDKSAGDAHIAHDKDKDRGTDAAVARKASLRSRGSSVSSKKVPGSYGGTFPMRKNELPLNPSTGGPKPIYFIDTKDGQRYTADQVANYEGSGSYTDSQCGVGLNGEQIRRRLQGKPSVPSDVFVEKGSGTPYTVDQIAKGQGTDPFIDPVTGMVYTRDQILKSLGGGGTGNTYNDNDMFTDQRDGKKYTAAEIAAGAGSGNFTDPNGKPVTREDVIRGLGRGKGARPIQESDVFIDQKTGSRVTAAQIATCPCDGSGIYTDPKTGQTITREQIIRGMGGRKYNEEDVFINRQTGVKLTAGQIARTCGCGVYIDQKTGETVTRDQIVRGLGGKAYLPSDIFCDQRTQTQITAEQIARGEGSGVYVECRTGETLTREQITKGLSLGARIFLDKTSGARLTVSQITRGEGSGFYVDPRTGATITREQITKCICLSDGTPLSLSEHLEKEERGQCSPACLTPSTSSRTVAISTRMVPKPGPARSPRPQSHPCTNDTCEKMGKRPVKSATESAR